MTRAAQRANTPDDQIDWYTNGIKVVIVRAVKIAGRASPFYGSEVVLCTVAISPLLNNHPYLILGQQPTPHRRPERPGFC